MHCSERAPRSPGLDHRLSDGVMWVAGMGKRVELSEAQCEVLRRRHLHAAHRDETADEALEAHASVESDGIVSGGPRERPYRLFLHLCEAEPAEIGTSDRFRRRKRVRQAESLEAGDTRPELMHEVAGNPVCDRSSPALSDDCLDTCFEGIPGSRGAATGRAR